MHEFRVSGQRWKIIRENQPGLWGECDNDEKRIRINPHLRTRKRLEILIHEMCHALFWDASEEAVTEAGKVMSEVLLADGWKRGKIKPIKAIDMKVIRDSHIEAEEGMKYTVVEFQAGDTIPAGSISIDNEWHMPHRLGPHPMPEVIPSEKTSVETSEKEPEPKPTKKGKK